MIQSAQPFGHYHFERKGRKNTAEPAQQTLKQYTYLTHYNETRIKKSLDWISPVQYRKHLGLAA